MEIFKNKKALALLLLLVILIVIFVIFYPKKTATDVEVGGEVGEMKPPVIPENLQTRTQLPSGTDQVKILDNPKPEVPPLELNAGNFENLVLRCFKGEPCVLKDDPTKMYQEFKSAGNKRAMDNLISFLRSKLRTPEFRDKYKDVVKDMIADYYPPEEKQFQEAAYYNYLGDLNKSLELYLDLQAKAKHNPNLKNAPALNIANTYYDLRKYAEAQPYYEQALAELTSGAAVPTPDPTQFVEERIAEIKARLYHYQ
ncbi:tetratricopeptide repeat protein [Bdellovibrio sp. HCB290]|uniref:tetratricopeptide repeat protein n=1 Tax=Bdellovibrio sp. HCB290 TaxID=3394356 RepID=UPI0039B61E2D